MKTLILAAFATLTLAACGVDGPPVAPQVATTPGVSVTGDARIGMRADDL